MLQPSTFLRTPEEVAMSLNQLTEADRNVVKGIIIGLKLARKPATGPRLERERPRA